MWSYYGIVLLTKKYPSTQRLPNMSNFRPIYLLPVICELYMRCLILMAGPRVHALSAPQFAFRPGHQAPEFVFTPRRLIEVCCEWKLPLDVLDGGLAKAYDYTRRDVVLKCLMAKRGPAPPRRL